MEVIQCDKRFFEITNDTNNKIYGTYLNSDRIISCNIYCSGVSYLIPYGERNTDNVGKRKHKTFKSTV